jgi:CubicO group peptidase (beta-lactamase class C family)
MGFDRLASLSSGSSGSDESSRMRRSVPSGIFLGSIIVLSCAWLTFYAHGATARAEDQVLQGYVARGHFSGAVLVSQNGQVIFQRAYGMADAENKTRNSLQTRFRIGSLTKTFTAIIVMQLEQEHRLAVSDPICKYIADCPPEWGAVTLHHLLSHTSGIYNLTRTKPGEPPIETIVATPHTQAQILERFIHEPLAFIPGTQFQYSNSNYWLLSRVIERVTGQSYEHALQERIFDPAGMRDSGLTRVWPTTPHAAVGYWESRQRKIERAPVVDGSWSAGDGGIYSTALDLQRFSDALDSGILIPRATLERMRTPVTAEYGYGWSIPAISSRTANRKEIGHGGALPGFGCQFQRFESEKLTVIVLSNNQLSDPTQVALGLESVIFNEPYTPSYARETVEVAENVLRRYVGDYDLEGVIWTVLLRNGHLYVRAKDGSTPDLELLAESEEAFFLAGTDSDITVVENQKGEVYGLSLNLSDASRFAKKIR